MVIYHVADPADWEAAKAAGDYRISKKGQTLEQEGFIHASDASQVAPVANRFYQDEAQLIVLVIDTDKLASEVRYDDVPGWDTPFPHIYGPINLDAVTDIRSLERDSEGVFHFEA